MATGAGRLDAQWVIHTVGPNWNRGDRDPAGLASCFARSLDVAAELGARSVAFPAVGGGSYGWAMDDVAAVAVETVRRWGAGSPDTVALVRFVLFDERSLTSFVSALADAPSNPT